LFSQINFLKKIGLGVYWTPLVMLNIASNIKKKTVYNILQKHVNEYTFMYHLHPTIMWDADGGWFSRYGQSQICTEI